MADKKLLKQIKRSLYGIKKGKCKDYADVRGIKANF